MELDENALHRTEKNRFFQRCGVNCTTTSGALDLIVAVEGKTDADRGVELDGSGSMGLVASNPQRLLARCRIQTTGSRRLVAGNRIPPGGVGESGAMGIRSRVHGGIWRRPISGSY